MKREKGKDLTFLTFYKAVRIQQAEANINHLICYRESTIAIWQHGVSNLYMIHSYLMKPSLQ